MNPRSWTSWDDVPLQLTTKQVCELFNVGRKTVRKWRSSGLLNAGSLPDIQGLRYPRGQVMAFALERNLDPFSPQTH